MCFDGLARVSRAAAQLAFFVNDVLDVYGGKAIWNVFIDSLFLIALPVLMLATVYFWRRSLGVFHYSGAPGPPNLTFSISLAPPLGARLSEVANCMPRTSRAFQTLCFPLVGRPRASKPYVFH